MSSNALILRSKRRRHNSESEDEYKKRHRYSKISDVIPRHYNHAYSRSKDRYRSRRSSNIINSDDMFKQHTKSRHSENRHQLKRKGACSRTRDNSFSSDDYYYRHRKDPSPEYRHRLKNAACSRARSRSSDDSDCRYHKHKSGSRYDLKRKRACSRRRASSFSSTDSHSSRHHNHHNSHRKYECTYDVPLKRPKERHSYSPEEFKIMKYFYEKSGKCIAEGHLKKALEAINVALKLCKEEKKCLSLIYSRRGTILSLLEMPRCSFQGFLDWEYAYILDKNNMEARKNMSKVVFKGANKSYRMKKFKKALSLCKIALNLYENNGKAYILTKLIKRKLYEKKFLEGNLDKNALFSASSLINYNIIK